jgi:putative ABC transport system permease protein
MVNTDALHEIADTLARHKLRTALTAFGVFWGMFMLVLLIGAGQGLMDSTARNIGGAGGAITFSSTQPTSMAYKGLSKGRSLHFVDADIDVLEHLTSDIAAVVPTNELKAQALKRRGRFDLYALHGDAGQLMRLRNHVPLQGRAITVLDNLAGRKVAVLGTRARKVLFKPDDDPIGQAVEINGVFFQVVGVFDTRAAGDLRAADIVYIPNTTLRKVFGQRDRIDRIVVVPAAGADAAGLEQRVKQILQARHLVHPDDPAPIASFNMQQQAERQAALYRGVYVLSWIVAGGALLSGVIGVGNIMSIAVRERRREIGIRKALGAAPRGIVAMVLAEALVIVAGAGGVGLMAGVAVLELASALVARQPALKSFTFTPAIDPGLAALAIALLLAAALLAALVPALRAADMDVVLALQET